VPSTIAVGVFAMTHPSPAALRVYFLRDTFKLRTLRYGLA
jgi:hypothetical protein